MQAHSNPDGPVRERALRLGGRRDRIRRARERDEERVALRVHLDAAVVSERLPQRTSVLVQQVG